MTDDEELAAVFEETEFTVPVQHLRTGTVVRGFLDRNVELLGSDLHSAGATLLLHLIANALPGMLVEDRLRVGKVGADAVAPTDTVYVNRGNAPHNDDGAFDHIGLVKA